VPQVPRDLDVRLVDRRGGRADLARGEVPAHGLDLALLVGEVEGGVGRRAHRGQSHEI
jgi:hypothetical protein